MNSIYIYVVAPSLVLLLSGVASFVVRQTPGEDEAIHRWITRGFGALMITGGLLGAAVASLLLLLPSW